MKTQSKGTNVPTPAPEALDEKITQLTEEVAKKAKTYWVPVLIAIIVVFAFMAVSSLMSSITEGQQQDLSESVYALFNSGKTPEEIRSQAPQLGESLRPERRPAGVCLCRLRIGRSDAEIVRLCRIVGEYVLALAGGQADNLSRSDHLPDDGYRHIRLTDMDAVGVNRDRDVHPVVDE